MEISIKGFVTIAVSYTGIHKGHWGKTEARAKKPSDNYIYQLRLTAAIEIPDSEIISYLQQRGFSVTRKLDNR